MVTESTAHGQISAKAPQRGMRNAECGMNAEGGTRNTEVRRNSEEQTLPRPMVNAHVEVEAESEMGETAVPHDCRVPHASVCRSSSAPQRFVFRMTSALRVLPCSAFVSRSAFRLLRSVRTPRSAFRF
jgi:hypothetical protein